MPETPAFLAERLKTEGDKTAAFFAALTADQWKSKVYTEGETWTIRNVLAHYVTAEKGFVKIFSSTVRMKNTRRMITPACDSVSFLIPLFEFFIKYSRNV